MCDSRYYQYYIRYHEGFTKPRHPVSEINDAMRDMLQWENRTDIEQESTTECKAIGNEDFLNSSWQLWSV